MWIHRRDYFVHYDPNNPNEALRRVQLLGRVHLWRIQSLSVKYRSMLDRKAALRRLWSRLSVGREDDRFFNEVYHGLDSIEEVADLQNWVSVRFQDRLRNLEKDAGLEADDHARRKRVITQSRYARARSHMVARLAEVGCSPLRSSHKLNSGTFRRPWPCQHGISRVTLWHEQNVTSSTIRQVCRMSTPTVL